MTEKKFKNVGCYIYTDDDWYCTAGGEYCANVIATALNELTDENKQLKQQVHDETSLRLANIIAKYKDIIIMDINFNISTYELEVLLNSTKWKNHDEFRDECKEIVDELIKNGYKATTDGVLDEYILYIII